MKQLITVLNGLRDGNFSSRLPADWSGLEGRVADTFNHISARMENFNTSLVRMRRQVGEEGKIDKRMPLGDSVGGWAERIEAINALVDELSQPTVEVGRVIGAVAKGDLSQTMALESTGARSKASSCAPPNWSTPWSSSSAPSRRSHARGPRSRHRRQTRRPGQVKGVSGVWKDLTDRVNRWPAT